MKASVIIPTYRREESLISLLESLLNQQYDDFELIIVDQYGISNEKLLKIIRANENRVKYFKYFGRNASAARNYALKEAKGNIIISCDDDVIAEADFIKNHVINYDDKTIGAVSGRALCENDIPLSKIKSVGRLRVWDGKVTANFNADFRLEIEHVYGCNASFRRKALIEIGGYDERLRAHFDEADVSFKIRKLGYKIIFEPRAIVRHLRKSGGYRDLSFSYWYYHNFMIFHLKHLPRIFLPIFLARQSISILKRGFISKDFKTICLGIKGLTEGVRDYQIKTLSTNFNPS